MVRDKRMDRRQGVSDVGERILGAVQDAIDSGNFGQLNYMVQNTADTALREIRSKTGEELERLQANIRSGYTPEVLRSKRLPRRYFQKKGKPLGVLLTLFGGMGFLAFGCTACFSLVGLLVEPEGSIAVVFVFFAVFTLIFLNIMKIGKRMQKRLRLAERYVKLLQDTMYMEIEDLAARVGQDVKKVRRNLKDMLKAGLFPEGHMDTAGTLFVMTDEIWEQYLTIQKALKQPKPENIIVEEPVSKPEESEEPSEAEAIEAEGLLYQDKLRELNTKISGEVVSNKMYQMDYLLQRIFAVIKEHPVQCAKMYKFMDYYLPTTVKLLESYADFERAGIQTEHIQSAKTEIEKTLDSINEAFEKLLDEMYQNAAFEAAADAKVLKTILAQDGYMRSEFSAEAGKEG